MVITHGVVSGEQVNRESEVPVEVKYWMTTLEDGAPVIDVQGYLEDLFEAIDSEGSPNTELLDYVAENLSIYTMPVINGMVRCGDADAILPALRKIPGVLEAATALSEGERRKRIPDDHLDALRDDWEYCVHSWMGDVQGVALSILEEEGRMETLDPYGRIGRLASRLAGITVQKTKSVFAI
ncbi:MAG: hypothetical protein JWO96_270 [Candidatus Saccharibacteria bacterium]|nr:hypothetical protein [Candidatus Saccharibacteria bacterium]